VAVRWLHRGGVRGGGPAVAARPGPAVLVPQHVRCAARPWARRLVGGLPPDTAAPGHGARRRAGVGQSRRSPPELARQGPTPAQGALPERPPTARSLRLAGGQSGIWQQHRGSSPAGHVPVLEGGGALGSTRHGDGCERRRPGQRSGSLSMAGSDARERTALVITVLNEAESIDALLESIAQQTWLPAEVAVVDS